MVFIKKYLNLHCNIKKIKIMNLEKLNLVELSVSEAKNIEGGCWFGRMLEKVGDAIVSAAEWVGEHVTVFTNINGYRREVYRP